MIHQLIPDIYNLINSKGGWDAVSFQSIYSEIERSVKRKQRPPSLRLSALGDRCPKALWHSIKTPELAEAMPPWAQIKYAYGHIIEALAINLAKAAGHEVTGEQDELTVDGIVGHRDCVIDGHVVDVKSTSSMGFAKFRDKTIAESDSFGYLDQLDAYLLGSADDPLVRHKDTAYLWAIDKTLGHMVLYKHELRSESIRERIQRYKGYVSQPHPPACSCGTEPDGKSGNIKLDTRASYSPYKRCCFPNVRTFKYARGPVHLTKVVKLPDVPELYTY